MIDQQQEPKTPMTFAAAWRNGFAGPMDKSIKVGMRPLHPCVVCGKLLDDGHVHSDRGGISRCPVCHRWSEHTKSCPLLGLLRLGYREYSEDSRE